MPRRRQAGHSKNLWLAKHDAPDAIAVHRLSRREELSKTFALGRGRQIVAIASIWTCVLLPPAAAQITNPYGPGTDASSAAPTALSTLSSGNVVHAGQLYCQNQSAVTLQLILNPGSTPTIILMEPGAGANRQGADWQAASNMPWFTGAFVLAGPAGSQAACNFN